MSSIKNNDVRLNCDSIKFETPCLYFIWGERKKSFLYVMSHLHFWRRSNFLGHFLPSPLWCLLIMRNFRRNPRPQVALQSLQGLQAVTTQSTGGVTALDELAAIIIMSFICRCLSSSIKRRLRSCQLSWRLAMYWLYWLYWLFDWLNWLYWLYWLVYCLLDKLGWGKKWLYCTRRPWLNVDCTLANSSGTALYWTGDISTVWLYRINQMWTKYTRLCTRIYWTQRYSTVYLSTIPWSRLAWLHRNLYCSLSWKGLCTVWSELVCCNAGCCVFRIPALLPLKQIITL